MYLTLKKVYISIYVSVLVHNFISVCKSNLDLDTDRYLTPLVAPIVVIQWQNILATYDSKMKLGSQIFHMKSSAGLVIKA